jgi:hypothetical protein
MQQKPNFFRMLQVMHKAFLLSMALLVAMTIFIRANGFTSSSAADFDRTLQVVALILAAGLPALGFALFNKRLAALQPGTNLKARIDTFRSISITRWALIEMPALFAVVCFLLTGNYAYVGLAVALILVFAATNPSKTKVIFQLQLTDKEVAAIESI